MTFKKNIAFTFLSKVSVAFLGLLMVVLISRNLGAEGRGHLSLFVSSIALVQLVADFGNSSAIINLSYTVNQRKLWLSSLIWIAGICLISYLFLFFFKHLTYAYLVPPTAFLYSAINLNQMLLMGNQKIVKRNFSLLVLPVILLLVFLILFTQTNLAIAAYPLALFSGLLISFLISLAMIRRFIKKTEQRFQFEPLVLKHGLWVQGAHAIQFFNYRLNFFLVAYFISDASLGLYSNAIVICESIWILGHSIGQMQHMQILNTSSLNEQIQLSKKMVYISLGASSIVCVLFLLIPNAFWVFLFSEDFAQMSLLFKFLIPGVLAFSVSNIYNHYFHAKSEFKQIFNYNLFGLLSGLVSALYLIPKLGIVGACLSWSIGLIVSMFFYARAFKKIIPNIFEKN